MFNAKENCLKINKINIKHNLVWSDNYIKASFHNTVVCRLYNKNESTVYLWFFKQFRLYEKYTIIEEF